MKETFLLILLVSALGFSLTIPRPASVEANENIIRVPSDFPTIQEAINTALPRSIILVSSGTYHEHLIVNKAVRLVGVDKTSTIIDGDNNGTAITVSADNVLIDGFTMRNCSEGPYSFGHGSLHLLQCRNCTISNNVVTQNVCHGIYLERSDCNTVLNNIVTFNGGSLDGGLSWGIGIGVGESSNNTIEGNIVMKSLVAAIYLGNCSGNLIQKNVVEDNNHWGIQVALAIKNIILHNNFVNCPVPVYSSESNNMWNDGAEGNYWDDYLGLDDGSNGRVAGDGVGDTDIPHHGVDNYPLVQPVEPIPILWENKAYLLTLRCNSTVSALRFEQSDQKFVFSVGGPSNTTGYFNVTVPKALLSGNPWKIALNGADVTSQTIIGTNQTHTSIYLGYAHSSHDVQLIGTAVVPEYPTPGILVLMMLLTLLSTINCRTKKRCNCP